MSPTAKSATFSRNRTVVFSATEQSARALQDGVIRMQHGSREVREKRKNTRYHLQLPVVFEWEDGKSMKGGFTRDISSAGMFILSTERPRLGKNVHFQLLIPTSADSPGNVVNATGKVVRLSFNGEGYGFALKAKLSVGNLRSN